MELNCLLDPGWADVADPKLFECTVNPGHNSTHEALEQRVFLLRVHPFIHATTSTGKYRFGCGEEGNNPDFGILAVFFYSGESFFTRASELSLHNDTTARVIKLPQDLTLGERKASLRECDQLKFTICKSFRLSIMVRWRILSLVLVSQVHEIQTENWSVRMF